MSEPRTHEFDLVAMVPGPRYCTGCAERVCARTAELDGVEHSTCDPEAGMLTVTYLPGEVSVHVLEEQIRRLALEETDSVGHAAYRLTGLD